MVGDGTYLMMNSDIYSSVLTGHKLIVVVCDNGGFAVIDRLQNAKGSPSLQQPDRATARWSSRVRGRLRQARRVDGRARRPRRQPIAELEDAIAARQGRRPHHVICIDVDAFAWTPGGAWWDVGVPEVSEREACARPAPSTSEIRAKQRVGV